MGSAVVNADVNIGPFDVIGYAEAYYVHDFADYPSHYRMITPSGISPVYSYNRADQFAINHALLDLHYETNNFRFAMGFQGGTYVTANYAPESGFAKYLYEGSVGFRVAPNLWIDGGVFPSHIGLESAISKDNQAQTRSLMADNTPYYESGAKATWEPDKHWLLSALVLRGWQSIDNPDQNVDFGTQLQFKPSDAWALNSSTFIGKFGGDHLMRYFHDFYVTWQVTGPLSLSAAFDIGGQELSSADRGLRGWYSAQAMAHYQFNPQWAVCARVEHYHDPRGITIPTATPDNFVASGASINLDYKPEAHVLLRTEFRNITADHRVFIHRQGLSRSDNTLTWSLILSL